MANVVPGMLCEVILLSWVHFCCLNDFSVLMPNESPGCSHLGLSRSCRFILCGGLQCGSV